jgi:hypothetical protein
MDGRIARGNSATCDGQEMEVTLGGAVHHNDIALRTNGTEGIGNRQGASSARTRRIQAEEGLRLSNRSQSKFGDTSVSAVCQSSEALDNLGRLFDN